MSDENKTTQTVQEERDLRAKECREQVNSLLEQFNCKPDVFITIGTDGRITGEFRITAKLLPKPAATVTAAPKE